MKRFAKAAAFLLVMMLCFSGCTAPEETAPLQDTEAASEPPSSALEGLSEPGYMEPEESPQPSPPQSDIITDLDYAAFLELLEANGFIFEEGQEFPGGTWDSPLSAVQRLIYIDGESIRVEVFDSNEVMERASALIGITSVGNPDYPYLPTVQITWAPESSPRWFKRDLIIVFYAGNDSRIIDFLVENLTFFVGFEIDAAQ